MMRMTGGNIRIPDIAFVSWSQLPGQRIPIEPIANFAPALAIEVLSSGNTRREMRLKREDYFASGTQIVWEINPADQTVRVFAGVEESMLLTVADHLDGGTVLPGFAVLVGDIFERLNQHG